MLITTAAVALMHRFSTLFSPDGKLVYYCFSNGDILVFNTRTNESHIESYAEMMGDRHCHSCTISSDGCFLILCMETEAFLYDRRTGFVIKQFDSNCKPSTHWIYNSPGFSPNGKLFAFSIGKQVYMWNISEQTPHIPLLKRTFKIVLGGPVALSDIYTAFIGDSGFLEIWDVETSTKVTEIRHDSEQATRPHYMVFSPDNQYILSSSSRTYFIWTVLTGELISQSTVNDDIYCLALSHDSKSIALGIEDCSTNVRRRDITSTQPGLHADVDDAIVSKFMLRDPYLILVYRYLARNCLQIWDVTTPNTVLFEAELTYMGLTIVCPHQGLEPDLDVHVAYVTNRGLCLWDKTTIYEITITEFAHLATALASSNKYIVSAETDDSRNEGIIKIWDIYTRDLVGGPYAIPGWVVKLCVSATGINFIVAYHVNDHYQFEVRQCESGRIIGGPFKLDSSYARSSDSELYLRMVAFSPDETHIICIQDESAEIVDVLTGKMEKWMLHMNHDMPLSLSLNGKYLGGIDDDNRVKLLDTDTGMPLNIPSFASLGRADIHGLGFSNDSKRIIIISNVDGPETITWESQVSVWDIQSGKMIVKLPFGFQFEIFHLNLSDGRLTIVVDMSPVVWDMNAYETISTGPQLVDSPRDGWSTSRTEVFNYALMAWKKASIPAFSKPDSYGWVRGLNNEAILWIPKTRRNGFWSPCAVHVPHRNVTKLNFNNFVHGTRWTECRNEISM